MVSHIYRVSTNILKCIGYFISCHGYKYDGFKICFYVSSVTGVENYSRFWARQSLLTLTPADDVTTPTPPDTDSPDTITPLPQTSSVSPTESTSLTSTTTSSSQVTTNQSINSNIGAVIKNDINKGTFRVNAFSTMPERVPLNSVSSKVDDISANAEILNDTVSMSDVNTQPMHESSALNVVDNITDMLYENTYNQTHTHQDNNTQSELWLDTSENLSDINNKNINTSINESYVPDGKDINASRTTMTANKLLVTEVPPSDTYGINHAVNDIIGADNFNVLPEQNNMNTVKLYNDDIGEKSVSTPGNNSLLESTTNVIIASEEPQTDIVDNQRDSNMSSVQADVIGTDITAFVPNITLQIESTSAGNPTQYQQNTEYSSTVSPGKNSTTYWKGLDITAAPQNREHFHDIPEPISPKILSSLLTHKVTDATTAETEIPIVNKVNKAGERFSNSEVTVDARLGW